MIDLISDELDYDNEQQMLAQYEECSKDVNQALVAELIKVCNTHKVGAIKTIASTCALAANMIASAYIQADESSLKGVIAGSRYFASFTGNLSVQLYVDQVGGAPPDPKTFTQ